MKVNPFFKHIIRFVGLFLVMNVFILSVHADDLDNEEFEIEQGIPSISQAYTDHYAGPHFEKHTKHSKILPEHHHNKRFQIGKHISVQLLLPKSEAEDYYLTLYESINHVPAVPKEYRYIYFKEINPPPPKAC